MSPLYQTTPFKAVPALLVAGRPSYLWGSYNDRTSNTFGYVISNSGTGTVASVTFQVKDGNLPVVGALITIVGTSNGGGSWNVTNATILSVSTPDNGASGVVTVTFAGAQTGVTTADTGEVQIPQPEIGEVIVNGASVPVAVSSINSLTNQKRALTAVVKFLVIPTTITSVYLQQAISDMDSEYANVGTTPVASVAAGVVTGGQLTVDLTEGRFFRFFTTGLAGAGTIVAKLLG